MGTDVDQRTAALLRLVWEYTPGRNGTTTHCMCLSEVDITQLALLAGTLEHLRIGAETVLVTDGELLARLLPGCHHLLSIFGGCCHGLFAHNMLAGLKCCNRDRAVRNVRGADMNNIDALVLEQFVVIAVCLGVRGTVLLGCLLSTLELDIAECDHLALVCLRLECREMLLICNTAAADDCYL